GRYCVPRRDAVERYRQDRQESTTRRADFKRAAQTAQRLPSQPAKKVAKPTRGSVLMSHVATLGLKPAAIPAAAASPFTRAYTRYAMGLLLAIYIVNFLDQQVVNILAEPIKND